MAVIALTSAKGSPGVTTTGLAMALAWTRPVLLVEADPAGGDIMAGYVRAQLPTDRGLAHLAVAARHDRIAEDFNAQLIDLASPKSVVSRVLLAGVSDPAQAASVAPVWDRLAWHFAWLGRPETGTDVIIDCGRLVTGYPPLPLIAAADVVLLVVRATLRSASNAKPATDLIRHGLGTERADRLGLAVVEGGEYRPNDLVKALRTPVVATLPWRPGEAAALSDGIGSISGSAALLRAGRGIQDAVADRVATQAARVTADAAGGPTGSPSGGLVVGPTGDRFVMGAAAGADRPAGASGPFNSPISGSTRNGSGGSEPTGVANGIVAGTGILR
jgi:MinD-like ATPase involved in chromosome partitioning or flagellar assembly